MPSPSGNSDSELYKRLKISRVELTLMTRQFAVLLNAGLEIRRSLETLSNGARDEDMRAILARLLHCIDSGWILSKSMAQFPLVFGQVYISMVEVGEQSGSLVNCLNGLADWIDSEDRLLKDVKSKLYYPVTVLVVALLLSLFFLIVIFPGFAESLGTEDNVPTPTRVLMILSSALSSPLVWFAILVMGLLAYQSIRQLFNRERNRTRFYQTLLHIPLVGPILRDIASSRFSAAFSILQQTGVDYIKSFRLACLASGSPLARQQSRDGLEVITSGGKLSDFLSQHPEAFSRVMVDLIRVGEETATLPNTCSLLHRMLESDAKYALGVLIDLLEPLLMLFVSCVVIGFIICTALPMYNQISNNL